MGNLEPVGWFNTLSAHSIGSCRESHEHSGGATR
jgi:hypothetical protein